jgi:hypothetical protein
MSYHVVRASSSNTILVLRVLSQIVDGFMAIGVVMAFERIQWLLIARKNQGVSLALVSAIAPSTSFLGLCRTLFRRTPGLGLARLWTLVRLLSLILLFGLGVLIMSMAVDRAMNNADNQSGDVKTERGYHIITSSVDARSFAFQEFNISSARLISLTADSYYGASLDEFLLDTRTVIDLTPEESKPSCTSGYDSERNRVCIRTVFVPGVTSLVVDERYPLADLVVVHDALGYLMDFDALEESFVFDDPSYCRVYGTANAAAQYCFAPGPQGGIAASTSLSPHCIRLQVITIKKSHIARRVAWTIRAA